MKVKSRAKPQALPTDSVVFRKAMARLEASGMIYLRPTQFLLKVAHWNYYPDTQTLQRDGEKKMPTPHTLDQFMDRLAQDVGMARAASSKRALHIVGSGEE